MLDEPQYLSTFYLSAFLDTLMEKGWDIFVVRGDLPKYNPLKYSAGIGIRVMMREIRSNPPQSKQELAKDTPKEFFKTKYLIV